MSWAQLYFCSLWQELGQVLRCCKNFICWHRWSRKEWKDKLPSRVSNLDPETGSPVHYKHQAITPHKRSSPYSFLCTGMSAQSLNPGSMPWTEIHLFILPFFTCVSRVILTIPSPGELRLPNNKIPFVYDYTRKLLSSAMHFGYLGGILRYVETLGR